MYKLKLATTKEDILEFEQKRAKAFSDDREFTTLEQTPYGKAIEEGDMLAFHCMKDKESIGGMLLKPQKRWIKISHLFVDQKERKKGAGTFMLDYVNCHKEFFEDYFGTDFEGVIVEPLQSSVDYYFDKGFDYQGFQMYKRYERSR